MIDEVDVATLLATLDGEDAVVVGGEQALDRPVGRVRLAMPAPNRPAGGEVFVADARPGRGAMPTTAHVAQLASAGASALVVLVDESVPPAVGEAADHHRLALVAWRSTASTEDAFAALVDARARASVADAMREAQAAALVEAHERFAAVSLEELISGHSTDPGEIAERAASFGWDLDRPLAVLLASIDPPIDRDRLPSVLSTIAAAARASLGAGAIVWSRTTTIAALVPVGGATPAERRSIAERLRVELDHRVRSVSVSIGIGRAVNDPTRLAESYAEAARAVDVGRWAHGQHVVEVFDELGLERLLASVPTTELDEFVDHALGPLIVHDDEQRTELVATLDAWLVTRNMAEAARRLHVHYNTMKNRLERIEALLGPVIDDPARRLECEVAMHIVRHHRVRRRS